MTARKSRNDKAKARDRLGCRGLSHLWTFFDFSLILRYADARSGSKLS